MNSEFWIYKLHERWLQELHSSMCLVKANPHSSNFEFYTANGQKEELANYLIEQGFFPEIVVWNK